MPRFVLPGANPGLLVKGTIDIDARAKVAVHNKDGTISSVRTISAGYNPDESTGRVVVPQKVRALLAARKQLINILMPTVIPKGGKWAVVSDGAAISHCLSSGRHLGVFDTPAHATAYGNRLHLEQAAAGAKANAGKRSGKRVIIRDKNGQRWNCLQVTRNGQIFLNDCHKV